MCFSFQKSSILVRTLDPLGCQKTSPPPASSCFMYICSCDVHQNEEKKWCLAKNMMLSNHIHENLPTSISKSERLPTEHTQHAQHVKQYTNPPTPPHKKGTYTYLNTKQIQFFTKHPMITFLSLLHH